MKPGARGKPSGAARLDEMIAEATADCYDESEARTGFFSLLEENLAVPFETTLLGIQVKVERLELSDAGEIAAVCRRGKERLRISILDLPLPTPRPAGTEWIDAYKRWAQGR
jgi:uncharacterized protein (UPF0262 family)